VLAHITALILGLVALPAVPAENHPLKTPVGAYIWGGLLGERPSVQAFHDSVAFLLANGFSAVRFTVTPSSLADYGLTPDSCPGQDRSPCYLDKLLAGRVFDDPRIRLLMITLHDFTSAADERILDPVFLTAHRDEIVRETEDDLAVFGRRFPNRHLTVVVSNWEGDNLVYCGHTFQFASDAHFNAACAARSGGGFAARLRAFQQWIALRDEAIRRFQRTAPGLDVIQAPEFSNLNMFGENCRTACNPAWTVFETLSKRPLCSYSAYDSSGRGTLGTDLPRILETCDRVIIGELGFERKKDDWKSLSQSYEKAALAIAPFYNRLAGILLWHAFENPRSTPGFALYDNTGQPANVRALPPSLR
jgi:hypothetical protein